MTEVLEVRWKLLREEAVDHPNDKMSDVLLSYRNRGGMFGVYGTGEEQKSVCIVENRT